MQAIFTKIKKKLENEWNFLTTFLKQYHGRYTNIC